MVLPVDTLKSHTQAVAQKRTKKKSDFTFVPFLPRAAKVHYNNEERRKKTLRRSRYSRELPGGIESQKPPQHRMGIYPANSQYTIWHCGVYRHCTLNIKNPSEQQMRTVFEQHAFIVCKMLLKQK